MGIASTQIAKVTTAVNGKLGKVMTWASQAQNAAESAIEGVGSFTAPSIKLEAPSKAAIDSPERPGTGGVPTQVVKVTPGKASFTPTGNVSFDQPEDPPQPDYGTAEKPNPRPSDRPESPLTTYPEAPAPARPTKPSLTNPTAPTFQQPTKPAMLPINVPSYVFGQIPSFDGAIPEATAPTLTVNPQVKLSEYNPAELQQRIAQLSMATMPPEFEDLCHAMTEEMVGAVDKETAKATDAAFTVWAAQNFSLPPGMLVGQINEAQSAGAMKIRAEKARLNNELFKTTFENYKAAMQTGLAMEKHLVDLELEEARQLLEIEKVKVRAQVELFNATVSLFNLQQQARQTYVTTHTAELEARIREASILKLQVDGAVAKTAQNEVLIGMYAADAQLQNAAADVYKSAVRASMRDIEVYKAGLEYHKSTAEIDSANITAYREAVKSYAGYVNASSEEVNAYVAEVQAVASASSVDESNARAYAQYMQAYSQQAGVYRTYSSQQGEVMRANLSAFSNAAQATESFVKAHAAKIAAQAEITSARMSAYSAHVQAFSSYNSAVAARAGALQHQALAAAENASRAQSLAAIAAAETDKVNAGAKAAKAQALAGLAQGAMSAMHVSASAQGSGGVSEGARTSMDSSVQWGGQKSQTESKRRTLSA